VKQKSRRSGVPAYDIAMANRAAKLYTAPIFDMLAGIDALVGKSFVFIDPEWYCGDTAGSVLSI
jgi:hypothetical protein